MIRFVILAFAILVVVLHGHGQDLAQIGIRQGVKLNGSMTVSTVGYQAFGISQRRDPFNWFLTGNLNINLFGYAAPFSFSYSNANTSYSQPFNQVSFSPQYKWVKTYIGYNAMTFSRYTLVGHVFFGGGVELSPGKWRLALMYGRLKQAVPFQLNDSLQYSQASFRRMGFGVKVGYENNGDKISFNIFSAKDDVRSIPFVLPNTQLTPMQNLAMGLSVRKQFLRHFFVDAEYAVSVLNKNILAHTSDSTGVKTGSNFIQGLLPQNATNRYFDAINASVGYQSGSYSVQLKYERVAPEYQTLGAYYFNNDLRNITIAPTIRLLKGKMTVAANVGVQTNNLDHTRTSTTSRRVGSANLNFMPSPHWTFTTSYSNFSTYTNVKRYNDPYFQNKLDTLNFYQVSQSVNQSVVRMFGDKRRPQSLMFTGSFQASDDHSATKGAASATRFWSTTYSYSYAITESNTSLAASANVYKTEAAGMTTLFWGPTLTFGKSWWGKVLRLSLATTYNRTETSGVSASSPILNNRISLQFTPKSNGKEGHHNLSWSTNVTKRFTSVGTQPAFTEITSMLNYTLRF